MATNDFENEDFEIDEWGDPVKKRRKGKAASNQSGDPPVDEWGDPVSSIPVEREMQEYYSEREKMSLEKRLVAEGKIYPRAHYMPRGRFRGIVAVCLAFVFGMFISLGALVGTGFFIGKSVKIKSLLGDKASEYLTEDYLDMSIVDLISTVAKDVAGGNLTDLNGIAKYTPVVDTLIGKLNETISQYGITLDAETLKSTKFTNYATYFMDDVAKNIELGKVVQLKQGSNPLLLALCYGEEGIDYSFGANGEIIPIETGRSPLLVGALMEGPMEAFRDLRLGTMLGISTDVTDEKLKTNALMFALAYGKRGVDYKVENGRVVVLTDDKEGAEGTFSYPTTIGDLIDDPNEVINTLELGAMLGIDTDVTDASKKDNALMYSLCYGVEGKDYKVENGTIIPLDGRDPQYPTTVKQLTESSNAVVNGLELGAMLGIASGFTEDEYKSNTLMYSIAYGNEGTDYRIDWENGKGKVVMLEGSTAKTVKDLTENSNELINGLELGTMLGIGTDITEEDKKNNALMLSICYGKEGEDYDVVKGKVVMREGHSATTVGELTENSNELIQKMEVETLMEVTPQSDKLMHYLAYGNEMAKDEHGEYLKDASGKFTTETVKDENGNEILQYVGGGKYVYIYGEPDAEGVKPITGIQMLPDPNKTDGSLYPKRTVGDLTEEDAGILDGMKIGDVMEIGEDSSNIMKVMKDWTLDDLSKQEKIDGLHLKDILDINDKSSGIMRAMENWTLDDLSKQEKIESLTIGEVLDIKEEDEENTSKIMWALREKSLAQLEDQETINGLKLNEILEIDDSSSGIMKAMKDWTLDDLTKQNKINGLKLGDILEIDDSSSGIMKAMKTWTLENLSNQGRIERLRVKDVIGTGDSSLMKAISDWRIGDLSKQEKINSLTLGDVIADIPKDGILHALADTQIGKMQERIDTLTLVEMLDKKSVEENKILKHLANSTVKTLADDLSALTIGQVFEDQVYSYMKIKNNKTYQDLYNEYFIHHADSNQHTSSSSSGNITYAYSGKLPKDLTLKANEAKEVVTYRTHGSNMTHLTEGYYTKNADGTFTLHEGEDVKIAAGATETPYYFETEHRLTPTYKYQVVDYNTTAEDNASYKLRDLTNGEQVTEEAGKLYFVEGEERYEIMGTDDLWYEKTVDGKTTRVDLEKVIASYSDGSKTYTYQDATKTWVADGTDDTTIEVLHKNGKNGEEPYDYYLTKTDLYLRYADGTTSYDAKDTVERYEYQNEGGETVQLDRYASGIWFLLLGSVTEPTAKNEYNNDGTLKTPGTAGKISFSTEGKLLEMDETITNISGLITDTTLWELYFHQILPEEPYVPIFTIGNSGKQPVTFVHGDSNQEHSVWNLSDVAISELVALVQALIPNI